MNHVDALKPYRLAIELMRLLVREEREEARSLLQERPIELHNLCPLLARWRMAGYVYTLVEKAGLAEFLPPEALHVLAQNYQLQADRANASTSLLLEIQEKLASAGVPFLTMKGLYLAQRFFGGTQNRYMWDIDILVPPESLEISVDTLAEIGLESPPGFRFDATKQFWGIHAIEVRGEAGKVDIHHAIRTLPGMHFDDAQLWRHSKEFTLKETSVLSLGDEETLFVAALGLGSDLQNSHHRLRKVWDIYIMLREMDKDTDWRTFFRAREKDGSLKLIINVFSFCLFLTGARGEAGHLCRELSRHSGLLLVNTEPQAHAIFSRGKQHLANRILFSRLLPVSPLNYFLSWLVSLPARSWHFR